MLNLCAKIRKANENTFLLRFIIRIINTFASNKNGLFMNKMNVNALFSLLLLLLLLTSCSRKYKVEGNSSVPSIDGRMLYLKTLQGEEWIAVDSAEVLHGLFAMEGKADTACLVTLFMNDEGLMPLVLEHGKIKLTISNTQLRAEGTPLNDALYEFIDKRNEQEARLAELERKEARMVLEGANIDEVRAELTKEAEVLVKEMNDYVKTFISGNYENPLGAGVFMMVCSSMPYPVMTPLVKELMLTAPTTFKEHPFVKEFLSRAKENMHLMEEQQRLQENAIVAAEQEKQRQGK